MRRISLTVCVLLVGCTASTSGGAKSGEIAGGEGSAVDPVNAELPACVERVVAQPPSVGPDDELPACVERVAVTNELGSLALIDGQLAWTSSAEVFVRSPDGETIRQLQSQSLHSELVAGASEVLVCSRDDLLRAGPLDCALEHLASLADRSCPVTAHGGALLYRSADGELLLRDAGSTTPVEHAVPRVQPVMDDHVLAWAQDNVLFVRSREGGEPRELVREPLEIRELTLDGGYAYWAMNEKLRRVPLAGGPVETLANHQTIRALQVAHGQAIWRDGDTWAHLDIGAARGRSVARFSGARGFGLLALGPDEVYVAREQGQAIYAVAPARCVAAFSRQDALRPVTPPAEQQRFYADDQRYDAITFDVEDLSESEWREASELLYMETVAADDPRIPQRFRPGTRFVMVGADGRLDVEVSAFRVGERDAVEVEVKVECPQQVTGDEQVACVRRAVGPDAALFFRPNEVPPQLQVGRVQPVDKPLRATIEAKIRAIVRERLPAGERVAASEIHVTTTRARLPAGGVAFVSVTVDGDDDEWGYPRLTGFGIADASGGIIHWISEVQPPTDTYAIYSVGAVFDLDADGLDEALVTRSIFEGFTVELLWPARGYASELVAGEHP